MQRHTRQALGSFLDTALDNRYVRWAGGLLFLVGAARAVLGKVGDDPVTALTLILTAAGVLLLSLPFFERIRQKRKRGAKADQRQPARVRHVKLPSPSARPPKSEYLKRIKRNERRAARAFERELVTLVDEWKLVRGNAFRGTDFGTYSLWERKSCEFIGGILGETERQRFQSNGDEVNLTLERQAELRIRALERLRDAPGRWKLVGKSRDHVRTASEKRRLLSPQERIVLAGTPELAKTYENA